MEWSNDSVLQLIDAYRIRPVLWNSSDPYYKNKNKKEDAWRELADMLSTDGAEIKKKMQSLLASFRREKQKLKTTSGMGTEEVYDTKWFAFKSLLFLKNKNQPVQTRETEGNNENEFSEVTQDEDLGNNTDRVNNDFNETNSNESNADNEETISKRKEFVSPKRIPKKKTKSTEDPRVADAYAVITDLKSNISAQIKDGCSAYGEHIGFKLRTYSSYTRAIVEHHINNIIFNADMVMYAQTNNFNVQLPTTTTNRTGYYSSPASSPALSPAASSSSNLSNTSNFNVQIPTTNNTGHYFNPALSPTAAPSPLISPTAEQSVIVPPESLGADVTTTDFTELTSVSTNNTQANLISYFTGYKN